MKFSRFYLAIGIRLAIIILLSVASVYILLEYHYYLLSAASFILVILAGIELIVYFNRINRWISFFLLGIKNEDTSLKIPRHTGNKAIDEVFKGMNNLNEIFKQTKIEIATKEQYFKTIINKSATGLFSVNSNGRIININPAATKLIMLQEYHHINSLIRINEDLPMFIDSAMLDSREKSAIFENKYGQKLLFKLSKIQNKEEQIRLLAVSDITKELDNREVDAWVKLARTLSHEIMNNITPITTLSQVISSYFTKDGRAVEVIDNKKIANTIKGLSVIEERSLALMNFVNSYRKFTKLPEPELHKVNISKIMENCMIAISSYTDFDKINLVLNIAPNAEFITDENLLSQVIINILKNAYESLIDNNSIAKPTIKVNVYDNDGGINIEIINNGDLIPKELREQIFIPFFTTKEQGSGIGLSLSKQIMLQMDGDIILRNTSNDMTCFEVILR